MWDALPVHQSMQVGTAPARPADCAGAGRLAGLVCQPLPPCCSRSIGSQPWSSGLRPSLQQALSGRPGASRRGQEQKGSLGASLPACPAAGSLGASCCSCTTPRSSSLETCLTTCLTVGVGSPRGKNTSVLLWVWAAVTSPKAAASSGQALSCLIQGLVPQGSSCPRGLCPHQASVFRGQHSMALWLRAPLTQCPKEHCTVPCTAWPACSAHNRGRCPVIAHPGPGPAGGLAAGERVLFAAGTCPMQHGWGRCAHLIPHAPPMLLSQVDMREQLRPVPPRCCCLQLGHADGHSLVFKKREGQVRVLHGALVRFPCACRWNVGAA
jgi:hypothetical protein